MNLGQKWNTPRAKICLQNSVYCEEILLNSYRTWMFTGGNMQILLIKECVFYHLCVKPRRVGIKTLSNLVVILSDENISILL